MILKSFDSENWVWNLCFWISKKFWGPSFSARGKLLYALGRFYTSVIYNHSPSLITRYHQVHGM